ncbi:uncharacterized protein Nmag_1519 [Natrialba magadii ATCC 43099]|uniref:Uncharacterized protein n=1 Tax=Natrialba magadii (strain ATCC 43099 / DSM 3394 / CCM 3739 / CIP 104546 / IAM 13178 / JCM 8861 / NBRC 102185 / NCIMB 2190 / MS3) TaxID=547559 RepID=D3STS8_NATMM|nr:hypothetical protein [Natrialba magadii]ADD05095.1 uncharacterized protein Nmag_1519 [Natrialba magadii ATCC 43099]ELY23330.1 hypothetical protein C500_20121 [Natrialba magadii ATCC 43099]
MIEPTRTTVLGVAILVVAIAGTGTALAIASSGGDHTEISVTNEHMTLSQGGESYTVSDDLSNVTTVEIVETDGEYTITTEEQEPIHADDREQAIETATSNDTVQQYLHERDDYELSVSPVEQVALSLNETDDTEKIDFEVTESTDSIVVTRDGSYRTDRAIVELRGVNERTPSHVVRVDLEDETIVSIHDV